MNNEYHLRVSVKHDLASDVINAFIKKFNPKKWICCYENKNDEEEAPTFEEYDQKMHDKCKINEDMYKEKNPHIHTYIMYTKVPTKQKISEFFKTQPILKEGTVAGYYHREQTKTSAENIIYTTKGKHFISYHGFTESEIENFNVKNDKINEDKQLHTREKLFNRYKENVINNSGYEYPPSKFELFKFIDETYVLEWNKSPLPIGHKVSCSLYILMRLHKEAKVKDNDNYNIIMKDLYNIKWDFTEYRDKIIEMKNRAFLDIEEEILENKIAVGKLKKEYGTVMEYL